MQFFRRNLALVLLAGIFSMPLAAQTADKLEALLENPALSWAEAAAFVLEASDITTAVYNNPADAFNYAMEKKWLPKKAEPSQTARFNGIALLLMRSFDQKGGIFYSLFKNPHYAYRELVQKEIIRGDADPSMAVSGEELLLMIGRILSILEQAESPAQEGGGQ